MPNEWLFTFGFEKLMTSRAHTLYITSLLWKSKCRKNSLRFTACSSSFKHQIVARQPEIHYAPKVGVNNIIFPVDKPFPLVKEWHKFLESSRAKWTSGEDVSMTDVSPRPKQNHALQVKAVEGLLNTICHHRSTVGLSLTWLLCEFKSTFNARVYMFNKKRFKWGLILHG